MQSASENYDILFVGEHSTWPLDQGFCIRGTNMSRALSEKGIRVALSSIEPLSDDAPDALKQMYLPWPDNSEQAHEDFLRAWDGPGKRARLRLADYQGRDLPRFSGVRQLVEQTKPKAVIGLGQHSVMMLRGLSDVPNIKRVWYAADELVRFQISCLKREGITALPMRMQKAALYAGLETFFVRGLDGAIGVSPREAKLLKSFAGAKQTTTIRNGVDMNYFHPDASGNEEKNSLVFWGRMDFEPNIDAVCWFAKEIWPTLRLLCPQARWQIVGKKPVQRVLDLDGKDGISVLGPVDDIRTHAHAAAITILPMRCGGGIKNKLLEAAAMGRPIVASEKAVQGLPLGNDDSPMVVAKDKGQWVETICQLWVNQELRNTLATGARQWVVENHSWAAAADKMVNFLSSLGCEIQKNKAASETGNQSRQWKDAA